LTVAESANRRHHAIAAWPVALASEVMRAVDHGEAALHAFQARHAVSTARWSAEPYDPFFNINTADDLRAAERIAVLAADHVPRSLA
jgi:molybdopterin-guanine dinucleotide biosynthesis protein A